MWARAEGWTPNGKKVFDPRPAIDQNGVGAGESVRVRGVRAERTKRAS